jgi:uncharacterized protein (TIGR02145 family)
MKKRFFQITVILLCFFPLLIKAQQIKNKSTPIESKKFYIKDKKDSIIYYYVVSEKFSESTGKYDKSDTIWMSRVYFDDEHKKEIKNSQIESDIASQKTALQIRNSNLLNQLQDSINVIKELNIKLNEAKNKIPNSKKIKKGLEPIFEMDYSSIGRQKWTSENLNKEQILALLPEINLVQETNEWNENFTKGNPAYCYHKDDTQKKHGVLLNIPAVKLLNAKLQNSDIEWRFPMAEDIDSLNGFLKSTKVQSIVSLMISNSQGSDMAKWSKPGYDLFDMHLVPLSYRRKNNTEWFGGGHEASFFCWNKEDAEMKSILFIAQINDNNLDKINLSKKDLTNDDNNFGVYVRLIKK